MRGLLIEGRHLTQHANQKEGTLALPATQGELLQPTYHRSVVTAQIIEPAEPLRPGEPRPALTEAHVAVTVRVQAPLIEPGHVSEGLLPLEPAQQQVWRSAVPGESLELPAEPVVKTE